MRISGAIFALALAASACAAVASCRAPTQVQLILKTDVPCQQLNGVIINVGSDAVVLENQLGGYFDAEVDLTKCQADGTLGTIYLAPGSDRGVVLVRAGYGTKQAVQCGPPLYKDCIVARRRFSYVDNITLTLTVKLDPDCLNVPCGALSTCASGKCIESFVSSCKDNACEPDPLARRPQDESDAGPGDAGSPDGSVDAGFTPTDASVPPDDSSTDASSTDGDVADAPGPDGATDAGQSEGGPDAGGPADGGAPGSVQCGFFVGQDATYYAASPVGCMGRCCGALLPAFSGGFCEPIACPFVATARTYDFQCDDPSDCPG
jgi:hypothetical protein